MVDSNKNGPPSRKQLDRESEKKLTSDVAKFNISYGWDEEFI